MAFAAWLAFVGALIIYKSAWWALLLILTPFIMIYGAIFNGK